MSTQDEPPTEERILELFQDDVDEVLEANTDVLREIHEETDSEILKAVAAELIDRYEGGDWS
jgi:hypothetical protein